MWTKSKSLMLSIFCTRLFFCTFGSWSDLCTTDCRLVLRQFTGSAIDPFGLPNNHLLLCSSRLFSPAVSAPVIAQHSPGACI